ncbi:MAG: serine/threonine-protein kinase [Isosphaeraceae bacterium]
MLACPSPQRLRRYGSGLPGDAVDPLLDTHINECKSCQAVLEGLAAEAAATTVPGATRMPGAGDLPQIPGLRMERELGRGGMGVVFLATELHADRAVAVKFLPSGPFAAPRDRERWLREARAAARVRHPNIVQLHRVGEAAGWLFLVLEYVPGGSLRQRVTGPLSPRVAATLLLPIARTLDDLHRAGVWHLDLKPANILVDAAPDTPLDRATLKLTDFGIARSCADADTGGSSRDAPRGTPLYMAPEQVAGHRDSLGPATDVHATGLILYELLTGRPPFLAESDAEAMHRARTEEPLSPRRLNPRLPRDLETICLKCLAKEPGRRYPSAGALADDLDRWLAGRPIAARPVSPLGRGWRWCRRRPAVAGLALALALSLLAGFLGIAASWRYAEAERARAEAERARAEEDFRTTADVLHQFVEFTTEIPIPKVFNDSSLIPLLESTRGQMLEIVRKRTGTDPILRDLTRVDQRLGASLIRQGRYDEALLVLEESVECLVKPGRKAPLDRSALKDYLWACAMYADATESLGRSEISVSYERRAVEAGEEILRRWPSGEALVDLARLRSGLANRLSRRGDHAGAHALLQANVAAFTPRPDLEMDHPGVPAWCIIAPLEMNRHRSRSGELGADPAPGPAARSDASNPRVLAGSHAMESLPAPAWAGAVLDAIATSVPAGGRYNEAQAGRWVCLLLERIAADDRNHDSLDDSRRCVERMVELGKALVSRYPDQPESFLSLSLGYLNQSKTAWKPPDYPEIERWLTEATEAARKAVTLDPANQDARFMLEKCRGRLDRLRQGAEERKRMRKAASAGSG